MHDHTPGNTRARWEIAGALFVVVAGSALHFVYGWTGQWRPVALIAAVNESVWEHLKLAFWPTVVFAALEYPFVKRSAANYWTAKAAGLLLTPAIIVLGFYGYTALADDNYLIVDIGLFVVAVALGHALSYAIMGISPRAPIIRIAAAVLLGMETAAFTLFTFNPPSIFLFEDPVHGHYGIPSEDFRETAAPVTELQSRSIVPVASTCDVAPFVPEYSNSTPSRSCVTVAVLYWV